MRKIYLLIILLISSVTVYAQTPSIDGAWAIHKDEKGRTPVIIIYSEDGKSHGYPIAYTDSDEITYDINNKDKSKRGNALKGSIFIYGLSFDGERFSGGKIYDPASGKIYNLTATMKDNDTLHIRASKDKSGFFGKSFEWKRVDNNKFKPLPKEEIKLYHDFN